MKINKLTSFLNKSYAFKLKDEWDINYLNDQNPFDNKNTIKNVVVCLDITDAIVEFAIKNKANVIISHHPLFVGSDTIKTLPYIASIAERVKRNHIQCIFLHTNFDKATNGMNAIIAKQIGLGKISFVNNKKTPTIVATVKNNKKIKDLAQTIASVYPNVKVNFDSAIAQEKVHQVAMVAGSGFSELMKLKESKKRKNVDTFITSDVRWHNWMDARNCNIKVIDVTHSIENVFVKELTKIIKKKIPNTSKVYSFESELKLLTLN